MKEKNFVRELGNLFLDVLFFEEIKLVLYEIKDRCKVDSVIIFEKKENVLSFILKILKF